MRVCVGTALAMVALVGGGCKQGGGNVRELGPEPAVTRPAQAGGNNAGAGGGESFDDFESQAAGRAAEPPTPVRAEPIVVADAPKVSPEPLPLLRAGLPHWVKGTPVKEPE